MPKSKQTLAEIAAEEDEKVRTGREAEGYVRVNAKVSEEAGHVMMLHFSPNEIALIRERANAKGLNEGQYVREAALGASEDRKPE